MTDTDQANGRFGRTLFSVSIAILQMVISGASVALFWWVTSISDKVDSLQRIQDQQISNTRLLEEARTDIRDDEKRLRQLENDIASMRRDTTHP